MSINRWLAAAVTAVGIAGAAPSFAGAAQLDDVASASLVIHAGAARTAASAVGPLAGATFTATAAGPGGTSSSCVTGASGNCTIVVAATHRYLVSEKATPAGWNVVNTLDYGPSSGTAPATYRFETPVLSGGEVLDVPGTTASGSYDGDSPADPFGGLFASSAADPSAPKHCGLRIALLLDQSGSMADRTKQADLKKATKAAISALTGTPSQMAIFTFADRAGDSGTAPLTSLATAGGAATLAHFVDNLRTPSGGTNWDSGIYQAVTATKQFDLAVVVTDGSPTIDDRGVGGGRNTTFHNVEGGIFAANALKQLGTRLVAIGVGADDAVDNLAAISGPAKDMDYYLGTAGTFDTVLTQLATGDCDGVLTVRKQIADAAGSVVANSPDADGWDFGGTVGATPITFAPTTTIAGQTGFTSSHVAIAGGSSATVTVTESLRGGYRFKDATCTVDGMSAATTAVDTAGMHPGISFVAPAGVPLACSFTNTSPSSLVITKLDAQTGASVAGATFQLFSEATVGTRDPGVDAKVGPPCVTTGSPALCTSVPLSFGAYYWQETSAPAGYGLPAGDAALSPEFTVDATHNGQPAATLSVRDDELVSALTVLKTDEGGTALAGAVFRLWRESGHSAGLQQSGVDADADLGVCTTAADGKCGRSGLLFGTYYWVEEVAPGGFDLPANPVSAPVVVSADTARTVLTTVVDKATAPSPSPSPTTSTSSSTSPSPSPTTSTSSSTSPSPSPTTSSSTSPSPSPTTSTSSSTSPSPSPTTSTSTSTSPSPSPTTSTSTSSSPPIPPTRPSIPPTHHGRDVPAGPRTPVGGSGGLAFTGGDFVGIAIIGALIFGVGALVLLASRRRELDD